MTPPTMTDWHGCYEDSWHHERAATWRDAADLLQSLLAAEAAQQETGDAK